MKSILKIILLLSAITALFFNSCTDTGTNSNRDLSSSAEISGFVNTSDTGEGIEAAKVTILGRNIEVDWNGLLNSDIVFWF